MEEIVSCAPAGPGVNINRNTPTVASVGVIAKRTAAAAIGEQGRAWWTIASSECLVATRTPLSCQGYMFPRAVSEITTVYDNKQELFSPFLSKKILVASLATRYR